MGFYKFDTSEQQQTKNQPLKIIIFLKVGVKNLKQSQH